jgi:hypothetical protein
MHAKTWSTPPAWIKQLAQQLAKSKVPQQGSDEYKAANVEFFKSISELLQKDQVWEVKAVSVKYTQGSVSEFEYLDSVKSFMAKFDDRKVLSVMVDLIRLMPDVNRRDVLMGYLKRQLVGEEQVHDSSARKESRAVKASSTAIEIPDGMFEPGSKKPCLIQALHAVLDGYKSTDMAQSILAAMENKINGLDRVQLSTLSEMRSQLLTLSEGRVKASWTQADSILALRPLLYRVMQIPETHKSRERQLMTSGWQQFVEATNNALSKFTAIEIAWIKVYVSLAVVRLSTIGVTETRRHDFPSLPMSAYFPSAGEPQTATASVPTRSDFPVGLPAPAPVVSLNPTAASNTQWRNSPQALRDEAFPELTPSFAPQGDARPDLSRPWTCPRCTYLNTRLLSTTCEICGMERPPPGEDSGTVTPDPALAGLGSGSNRPRRSKQKIILSSSTQRDYTR